LTADEEFLIAEGDRRNGYRLACCTQVLGDVKVHVPKDSLVTGQRLQVESNLRSIPPEPFVSSFPVEVPPPSLEDIRSDLGRLVDELQARHGLKDLQAGASLIRSLSPDLRRFDWRANVFVREQEILAVRPPGQSPLGLAVDLGTTKIAAFLVDLQTGEDLAVGGAPNP
jgi:uncharacterized 2Fe-2S/4Fe-4S cluster protein (DUF4445 family)